MGMESGSPGSSDRPRTGLNVRPVGSAVSDLSAILPAFRSIAVATYYRYVRFHGFIASGSLLALALTCGCDRGAHPANADKLAPDFTVSDGENTIHLANYRGKVVLLNFWWSQ